MNLPKHKEGECRKPLKTGYCQYENCGVEFMGMPHQKYCKIHMITSNRKRKRIKTEDTVNQVLVHNFSTCTDLEFRCKLPGCNNKFLVKVYPKVRVYPKYCECHRSEFKRKQFVKTLQNS